ncbi:MAG: ADP-ribosylglycohydrolase family protein [Treponemataceae bacterium]
MNRLFSKIYGCEAACTIGNSMGDVTELFTYEEIEARWGFVDTLLPQTKWGKDGSLTDRVWKQQFGPDMVYHAHNRPPGMTEDGHERHRLCTNAILKKKGRIDILDLARTWEEDIDPSKFGYLLGPQDQVIYYAIKSGIPPWEIGRYASWPALIGTSKMILPIGMVNACNPDRAAQDAHDLGRLKDVRGVRGNFAIEVCAAIAAACAEALKPDSSVEDVVDTALGQLSFQPREEVLIGVNWAKNANGWKDLRPLYQEKYAGHSMSNAVEILSGALACLIVAEGRPKETILYAVNLGRDTDCKAYVGGGFAGALQGIEAVPTDWVKTIEEEVVNDPYTVATRTARQAAEGLYEAAVNTANKMRDSCSLLDKLIADVCEV